MAVDPNIALMKSFSKRMVKTKWHESWMFRVEAEGAPADWDLFCKEITQTPIELEANTRKLGSQYLSYLNGRQAVSLTLTMRDNEDGDVYNWFNDWVGKVAFSDGTWGLPSEYLKTFKIFRRKSDTSEVLRQELRVQPMVLGELTESVERSGSLLEFPITVIEFRGSEINY